MVNESVRTGEILPRNYGIRIDMPGSLYDVFVSPAAYVLAQIMLESPAEIRERIMDWASRHNVNYNDALEELVEGVEKREGSKNILNCSRRTLQRQKTDLALQEMKHYAANFTGQVKSKGKKGYYTFSIPEPRMKRDTNISYPGARIETLDNLWNEGKGKEMSVIGVHLAVPEIALVTDEKTKISQISNITGLFPSERKMEFGLPTLPFTFNGFKQFARMNDREKEQYRLVTDLFMDYYLNDTSQYRLSINALENNILSDELEKAITHSQDRGRFKVLRQKQEEINKKNILDEDMRNYIGVTTLLNNIEKYLKRKWDYYFAGYMREFVGSEWETVAKRYEPKGKGPIYSVCVAESCVPVIVKRDLGHKALDWKNPNEFNARPPLQRIGRKYQSTDDVTRRIAVITEVKFPDVQLKKEGIYIPQNIQEIYDAIRRSQ